MFYSPANWWNPTLTGGALLDFGVPLSEPHLLGWGCFMPQRANLQSPASWWTSSNPVPLLAPITAYRFMSDPLAGRGPPKALH